MNTTPASCYHCGEACNGNIAEGQKRFCCEGCRQVYLLLNEHDLCRYYDLDKTPGITAKGKFAGEQFAYLDDEAVIKKLVQFSSATQVNVSFQLPQMHCASCIFLLENLHKVHAGVISSQANFQQKNVFIVFDPRQTSLRKVVSLLAFIGYEPYISLQDVAAKKAPRFNKKRIYAIGVAGFCFSNIMMLSFPEYFSVGHIDLPALKRVFTVLIFLLSLPVLCYSARVFFVSAIKGLRMRFLNIDLPITLAIVVTFARSYYEILSGRGAGYLDSGTGIVFFMLIGRWFQDKTYESFLFDRDYRSYFPLGVTILQEGIEKNVPATTLQTGDKILIRNEEMIPADAILISGAASIDYSFINGETAPQQSEAGALLYAGGKQCGTAITLEVVQPVSQSYITQLWNNGVFNSRKNAAQSFIHPWSRYFTLALFSIAAATIVYWSIYDAHKIWPAFTAVLIIACPCSLLLSATFTYGNMLRIFGKHKLYLKNAAVIESLAAVDTIVFDKTGTITRKNDRVDYIGQPLSQNELAAVKAITGQSVHPLSKAIAAAIDNAPEVAITGFKELAGKGLQAGTNGRTIRMGSAAFVNEQQELITADTGASVHLLFDDTYMGLFRTGNVYRDGMANMAGQLNAQQFHLHVLSGDNDSERGNLQQLFEDKAALQFYQSPQQKLEYIEQLQQQQHKVLMIGDGLNDAGALMQSDAGIAVSDNDARFTPACDAILDGNKVNLLAAFIAYAKSGKRIITACFVLSILYNIIGLSIAVQGTLSPVVAAILMPVSSISIVLLCTLLTALSAKHKGL